MPVPGERYFIKRNCQSRLEDHAKDAAAEEPAADRIVT
jgi:hypothetical protein